MTAGSGCRSTCSLAMIFEFDMRRPPYGTIVKPVGGGGSSMFSPGLASRLFELILIDPDTHWKNFAISPGARVFIIRTHSVTRFNCSVSFSAPHMHAMMFAILADFSSVTA